MSPHDDSLVLFDRDFQELHPVAGIGEVLQQWWEIAMEDAVDEHGVLHPPSVGDGLSS